VTFCRRCNRSKTGIARHAGLRQFIVGWREADLTVKYAKVPANFFVCFSLAFVDKKVGAIVFPPPRPWRGANVRDWSDPIGERVGVLRNYVSRIV
jgi:hypothetical protein